MKLQYTDLRTRAGTLAYSLPKLRGMTIKTVDLDNLRLTKDQYTFSGITLTLDASQDVVVEENQCLLIGYQWEKRI